MRRVALISIALALVSQTFADTLITLKNDFIEKYRNRITISVQYNIDKAHPHPNPGAKDGDLHIAGRSDQIGLPTVAEIMNAKDSNQAVQLVHNFEGGSPVNLEGVWRIWCEHSANSQQVQGAPLNPFTTTNPDHVFEIHPVLKIGGIDLKSTLHPIPKFTEKDADQAFTTYERTPSHITVNSNSTVTIRTVMAGYNYVKFRILPDKSHQAVASDGTFVPAEIQNLEGERLVSKLFLAFPKGSKAEKKLKTLQAGKTMTVLGIPRLSLQRVWWRVQHAQDRPGDLDWSLPYEMIIVGVY